MIKAVQAFKISPHIFRETSGRHGDSRSNTPSLSTSQVEHVGSQSSSGNISASVSIRDSRRQKNSRSQSETNTTGSQPLFQVNFKNAFESNGLDLTGEISDSFNSRFESLTGSKADLSQKPSTSSVVDPWGHPSIDKQSQPPPLPAKIVPLRAASTVPFTHSKVSFLISPSHL